jgi:urate oxidase
VAIVLGPNRYGKAETRLLHVTRDGQRHTVRDLTVSVALAGDLAATHLTGDNSGVLPTDSQKNTVYAFAAEHGVGAIEAFGLRLARHFVTAAPTIERARVVVDEYRWERIGPHSFARSTGERRTATLTADRERARAVSGLADLLLLSSTGSQFRGFVTDRYTTLAETDDRILATAVTARWRHADADRDGAGYWDDSHAAARQLLLTAFADTYSRSLQQTLYAMGERVLAHRPELVEVRLSLPNRHHFAVDLAPFGLPDGGEVFFPADRPYGLIEGTVRRDDAPDDGLAWW